ncbi:hypothetical protein [Parasitella parasitica]|uniref:Uncharacterized protein n=1 Tax=Parasitella parasitica TaxID=35722 RepID=A0A0B7NQ44_9FUNG|nr:hypothetical protein [Parasitella parasitica]
MIPCTICVKVFKDPTYKTHCRERHSDRIEFVDTNGITGCGLSARSGEGISQSTKRMAILNDYDSTFGRRSDTLVVGSQHDELANIELKKAATQDSLAKYQQGKHIRINSCVLNQANLMTDSTNNTILYYDFIGRHG